MELAVGDKVLLKSEGGTLTGVVDRFEWDGNSVVIMPTQPDVKNWLPYGYELGSAHWRACLEKID